MNSLRVLSLNVNLLGHIAYGRTLEATLAAHYPEVAFRALRLNEEMDDDILARAAFSLGTRRLPGVEDSGDADFYRFRADSILAWASARALHRRLREDPAHPPDVVHLHTRTAALHAACAVGKLPLVIDTDTTTAALGRHRAAGGQSVGTFRPLIARERAAFAHARRVTTWSEHARRSLMEDYDVAPEKVVTIPPGVPADFFLNVPSQAQEAGNTMKILFVGNDFSRKGGPDLVAVFLNAVLPDYPRAELHLVTGTAEPLPEHPAIRIHRGVKPLSEEARAIFAAADLLAIPTHEDTFGIALIEAMAVGLPCVSTTIFANPEIVDDGKTGYLVPPGDRDALADRLRSLAADPDRRRAMGGAGRARARAHFDPVTNVGRLVAVLREAAAAKTC